MEPVLLNDFRRIPPAIRRELTAATEEVVASGWFVLGKQVTAFERAWADYCATRHAIGVANGMDAIEIGVRTLNLPAGAEIITTPMTAFATVLGIIRAGATPVLADIDPTTGLLDPQSVERCISPRTRAVLLVHLYGQIRAVGAWEELCAHYGLTLLEDAAQAHGADSAGRRAGAIGKWAAYSFYPTKNLGCIGDGGALCTNDPDIAARSGQYRNYGQSERYHHPVIGLNSRLDEVQAAFLLRLLPHLPETTERRRAIASAYRRSIRSTKIELLAEPDGPGNHVYHLFVVRTRKRAALQAHLSVLGIQTLIHYPICIHHQPPTRNLRCDPEGLGHAELFAGECLSIPCHPYMIDSEVERVIAAMNSF
ncbi:MAG: DegT/DnrJ/EryC1/StrS family aminotransferase [Opitutaceae bacterium]|nr:DegT/DnrJ/EryC1/StrS family aminotransferase [Opitutaceae bacterium]